MGVTIREKPQGSGIWWIFINHKGRRKSKKIGTDEAKAREVAEKAKAKLVLGELDIEKPKKPTAPEFKKYCEIWLETYIKPLRRRSTYERYKDLLQRHVYPIIGKKPIDQIKRGELKALFLDLHRAGLSKASICLVRDVISGPMAYAMDEEILQSNQTAGIMKHLRLERSKKIAVEPMTPDEVNLVLSTAREHFRADYPFFLCAFRTGMRLGELLGLKWDDVDWNKKFIHVKRSYRRQGIGKTKTGKDRRVDMSDQLYGALRELYTQRKREALQAGKEIVEFIFHKDGKPVSQNSIRNFWRRILKKAGVRYMKIHITRHTFASLLLSNGESPAYVKEQLGHANISITVDIYGHLIPSSNREAVNRLDTPHLSAPQAHPAKTEKPQPVKIAAHSF
ncbi:MAG: site-specific integrase [Thermodesulfobacteriota bacterium]